MVRIWFFYICVALAHSTEIHGIKEVQRSIDMANTISDYLQGRNANISEECYQQLDEYNLGLRQGKLWALKMFDSAARFPGGILSGHLGDLGAFDQCMDINAKSTVGSIFGKYCLGLRLFQLGVYRGIEPSNSFDFDTFAISIPDINLTNRIPMMWAVCFPSACSAQEIQNYNAENGRSLVLIDELCQDRATKPPMSAETLSVVIFFGIIFGIMVLSTAYDICIYFMKKKAAHILLTAFSMFTNGKKLLECSKDPNQFLCLHGIRALSMIWILILHIYILYRGIPLVNLQEYQAWYKDPSSQFIIGSYVVVDSFLLMSGVLVCYIYMRSAEKGAKFNIVKFYVHRYLRLTPALGAVMLIHIGLVDHLVTSPTWPVVSPFTLSQPCRDNWWTALLYIQNYYDPTSFMCNGPTWYLSVDMQLYLISPLILIALRKKPKYALIALGLLTCGSILAASLVTWIYKIRRDVLGVTAEQSNNYDQYYYFYTHTRAAPWFIGVVLGYLIHITKRSKIDIKMKKYQLHFIILGLWGLTLAVLATCVFGGENALFGDYNRLGNTFYLGVVPSAWAVALSWLIFACIHGYGGPINWFLSLPVFQFISKVSYSMYLIHYLLLFMINYNDRTFNVYFSNLNAMYRFWPSFVYSLFAAVVLMLAFEAPLGAIEKVIFGIPKRGGQTREQPKQNTA